MRIAEIDVPKGCDKIYVDVESGVLVVSYGSGINKREVYNQYTRHSEELPGMGDLSVMWNDGARECAVIATVEGFAGEKYKANNNHEYRNADKFRDHQQYLDIRGIYGEDQL
jgi:hypothetical protein